MRTHPTPLLLCLAASLAAAPFACAQQNPHPSTSIDLNLKPGQHPAASAAPSAPGVSAQPLIPSVFAGWELKTSQPLSNPALADPATPTALTEYGFSDGLSADYSRDGQSLHLRALRFQDASGAYGAYTFYRQSGWPKEQIGSGAASDHNRILFWTGNVLIDATLPHVSSMTGSELRELAAAIPQPTGGKLLPPPILALVASLFLLLLFTLSRVRLLW